MPALLPASQSARAPCCMLGKGAGGQFHPPPQRPPPPLHASTSSGQRLGWAQMLLSARASGPHLSPSQREPSCATLPHNTSGPTVLEPRPRTTAAQPSPRTTRPAPGCAGRTRRCRSRPSHRTCWPGAPSAQPARNSSSSGSGQQGARRTTVKTQHRRRSSAAERAGVACSAEGMPQQPHAPGAGRARQAGTQQQRHAS